MLSIILTICIPVAFVSGFLAGWTEGKKNAI